MTLGMTETVRVKVGGKWYAVEVYDLTERPVKTLVDGYAIDVEVGDPVGKSLEKRRSAVRRPRRGAIQR